MQDMNPSQKGTVGELSAAIWLINQGWEVFRNVVPSGPIDLVAVQPDTGELIYVDVKSSKGLFRDGVLKYPKVSSSDQKRLNVRILHVDPAGGFVWAPTSLGSR